jgi:hypothetical protein
VARARQEILSLRDRFRPVRRGAWLGHAGKKEGAARWGQSVSRIEREGWGARCWAEMDEVGRGAGEREGEGVLGRGKGIGPRWLAGVFFFFFYFPKHFHK